MIELNVFNDNAIDMDVIEDEPVSLLVNMPTGGGITPSGTKSISITANGTYTEDVTVYANAEIDVNVSGGITPSGTKNISITANGTTTEDVTNYANAQITANVPNTYTIADEGKVVDDGALVSQTSKSITANGTHDTTTNNSVTVAVANSYTSADEGKVVSNGALVSQTSATYTANDTYDTTTINSVTVNVSGGGGISVDDIATRNITGNLTITANSISAYAFYGCTGINVTAPNATTIGQQAFMETGSDSTFDFPNVTTVGSNAFNNMFGNLYLPKCTTLSFPFQRTGETGKYLALPKLTTAIATDGLRTIFATIIDLGYTPSIGTRGLYQGNGKTAIILRKTDAVVALTSGALTVANPCKVYVPSVLKSSYQTATNWSSYSQITFENLEGSIYESETWPED